MEYETISDTEKSEHSTATHGPGERESLVAKIMRYIGLGLAALGALTLLAEGARRIDPVGRFFSFSLIISLSAVLGVYLAFRRKDHRNGRALVAVFLACVPVFWAQLGAVSYAGFQGVAEQVPVWFQMPEVPLHIVGLAVLLAAVSVVPLSTFAARIFAVGFERQFILLLSAMGLALAIPLRSGFTAMALLVGIVAAAVVYERRHLPVGALRYTADTLFVRAILLALPVIAAARASNYAIGNEANIGLAAIILVSGSVLAWCWDLVRRNSDGVGTLLSDFSIAVATIPLASYACSLFGRYNDSPYFFLLPACYLLLSAQRERELVSTRVTVAHYVALAAVLFIGPEFPVIDPLVNVGVPVAIAWYSVQRRYLARLFLSATVVLVNMENFFQILFNTIVEYRWSSLMVSGIALIFGASYVERGARRAIQHWRTPGASTANS
jgi:hypothetical protein